MLKDGISVIICCYNSDWIINRTLEGLKGQVYPNAFHWEIVLVNNKCTDDTVRIAEESMDNSDIDFTIVNEPNPGLANARRKGIDSVKYKYVLYCDDDNILCPNYVATMYNIISSDNNIGAVGGKGIAEFCAKPDDEVLKNIEAYAVGSQLNHKDWLFGAGLTLRTELVKEVYHNQHCYLMGRKGNTLLAGDDTELVLSMVNRGYRIHPTDDVYFTHVLKSERLTNDYWDRLLYGLTLPDPVFETMRAAIYGKPFYGIFKKWWRYNYIIIKYSTFVRWKSWAKANINLYGGLQKKYNFWGIATLLKIYIEWRYINCMSISKQIRIQIN